MCCHSTTTEKGGLTGSNDVIDDEDLLAGTDRAVLHLEVIGAVLLLVRRRDARAGQLALLPDGDECGAEAQGQRGSEQEASGI